MLFNRETNFRKQPASKKNDWLTAQHFETFSLSVTCKIHAHYKGGQVFHLGDGQRLIW